MSTFGMNWNSARPDRPTSVADLTNALVVKWDQIPAARFQNPVERIPKRADAAEAAY